MATRKRDFTGFRIPAAKDKKDASPAPTKESLTVAITTFESQIHPSELPFLADRLGPCTIIRDPHKANRLYTAGNFGCYMGSRMNFPNASCFQAITSQKEGVKKPIKEDERMDTSTVTAKSATPTKAEERKAAQQKAKKLKNSEKEKARKWIGSRSDNPWLFLSPVETLFLMRDLPFLQLMGGTVSAEDYYKEHAGPVFVRKYLVYRHLRRLGWIVRDGLIFGVDYLIYRESIETFHASAGVRIVDWDRSGALENYVLAGTQRELGNCKKVLLLAAVDIPSSMDLSSVDGLDGVRVEVVGCNSWFWNKERTADFDPSNKPGNIKRQREEAEEYGGEDDG